MIPEPTTPWPPAERSLTPQPKDTGKTGCAPRSFGGGRRRLPYQKKIQPSPCSAGISSDPNGRLTNIKMRFFSMRNASAKARRISTFAASGCRGVRDRPMRCYWLPRPDRTRLCSCVIADRENEIELWGVRTGKFASALGTKATHVEVQSAQKVECVRMDLTLRLPSRREGIELTTPNAMQNGLSHDGSRGYSLCRETEPSNDACLSSQAFRCLSFIVRNALMSNRIEQIFSSDALNAYRPSIGLALGPKRCMGKPVEYGSARIMALGTPRWRRVMARERSAEIALNHYWDVRNTAGSNRAHTLLWIKNSPHACIRRNISLSSS